LISRNGNAATEMSVPIFSNLIEQEGQRPNGRVVKTLHTTIRRTYYPHAGALIIDFRGLLAASEDALTLSNFTIVRIP
jgi:hypothetical protein